MTSLPILTDLKDLCATLRDVDRRLGETHDSLPAENDLAHQARGGIAVIRNDLLQDAIESLEALGQLDKPAAEKRRRESEKLLERLEEPWPSESAELRNRLRAAVTRLLQVDDELTELREHLALPRNAEAMWNSRAPMSFAVNLYALLGAMRSSYLQPAITALMHGGRQSTESLRRAFERDHGLEAPPTVHLRPDGSVVLAAAALAVDGSPVKDEVSSQAIEPVAHGQRPCKPDALPDLPFSSSGGEA